MAKLLDISALSELLSISTGSIRNALWRSQIGTAIPPPIRLGRRLRWETSTVERWLQEKAQQYGPAGSGPSTRDRHVGRPTKRSQLVRIRLPNPTPHFAATGNQGLRNNPDDEQVTPNSSDGRVP